MSFLATRQQPRLSLLRGPRHFSHWDELIRLGFAWWPKAVAEGEHARLINQVALGVQDACASEPVNLLPRHLLLRSNDRGDEDALAVLELDLAPTPVLLTGELCPPSPGPGSSLDASRRRLHSRGPSRLVAGRPRRRV